MRLHQNVLVVDEEAGLEQTTRLLEALGADPELVDKHLTYLPYPCIRLTPKGIGELRALLADIRPALALLDSCAAMMTAAGLDENSANDVNRFWYGLLAPFCQDFGCSVLLTDHDKHGGEGGQSRYARGSSAKLAATDVQFKLWPVHPFSRQQDGLLQLSVVKDRPGWLHRYFKVRVTRSPLALSFMKTTQPQPDEQQALSPSCQQLLAVLSDTPATIPQLVEKLSVVYGHGMRHQQAQTSLSELAASGLADRMDLGKGQQAMWVKTGNQLLDVLKPPAEDPWS
jgi:hypothetical protein